MVYNWLNNALNFIMGQHCLLCNQAIKNPSVDFCPNCLKDLPVVLHGCQQCGVALEMERVSHCGHCLTAPPNYDRVISAYSYASPVRQLMARYKFQRQLSLAPIFASALMQQIKRPDIRIEALLPVPLHAMRLRQRGFNQAIELAKPIAQAYLKPLLLKSIRRNRNTDSQLNLPAKQRAGNVRGAFEYIQPIKAKGIAIIDDVMTTGSTANELAKTLKLNGVEYVEVWCIARANAKH